MVIKKEKLVTVNLVFKREICYIEIINLLQFRTNVQKSHRQPQGNLQVACCSSELVFTFLSAGSSNQKASQHFDWRIHLSFLNFSLHPTPQTKM